MSRQITDGSSLAGTSIQELSAVIDTNRNCVVQITNHTNFPLTDPNYHCSSGYCYAPPQPIIEGLSRDACSFTKAAVVATGAAGVLTYRLGTEESSQRFALMFSVPYDFNLYSSWFGLSFVDQAVPADENLYKKMYYGKENADLPDRKRAKAKDGITLHVSRGDWKISATMSEAKKSIIHIEIMRTGGEQGPAQQYPPYAQAEAHHHHHQHGGWRVD